MIKPTLRLPFTSVNYDAILYVLILIVAIKRASATPLTIILFLIVALSLVCWLIARIQLGNAFSVKPRSSQLVTHGFYRYIRNPIYVFTGIANITLICILNIPWLYPLIPFMIAIQVYRAHIETKLLEETFGDEYRHYRTKTWV